MKIKEAISERFRQLCAERGISYTELARLAGITPSTVYSMLQPERKDVSAVTVKKLCDGLELCISDFYDDELFRHLPPEIE
jgi:DNA-binding Xre family transcriptional regulator